MSSDVQMPREYVANGSPYQADVCYTDSEAGQWASIVIDVGDVYQLPTTARYLTIKLILSDERQREILRNLRVNEDQDSDRSTIITEEGYTVHGHKNGKDSRDWMWKSDSDGTSHRPRKFFVVNASDGEIEVQPESEDGMSVRIKTGETGTFEYDRVRIIRRTSVGRREEVIYQGPVKTRTSIIVRSDKTVKTTGRLYGEDVEAKMWIVDGKNYQPKTYTEIIKEWVFLIEVVITIAIALDIVPTFNFKELANKIPQWISNSLERQKPVTKI